jgi:hypothetical protein
MLIIWIIIKLTNNVENGNAARSSGQNIEGNVFGTVKPDDNRNGQSFGCGQKKSKSLTGARSDNCMTRQPNDESRLGTAMVVYYLINKDIIGQFAIQVVSNKKLVFLGYTPSLMSGLKKHNYIKQLFSTAREFAF